MNVPVDYDRTEIPATYDRGHDHGDAVLAQWMDVVSSRVHAGGVRIVLDLACGTGRFAPALAARFGAAVIGLDPSLKMLRLAHDKCRAHAGVRLCGGFGEALPLRSRSVDLIFISMVFHHFLDPNVVGRECARVLRPGGSVFVRTITRDQMQHYPYFPFFPSIGAVLERRLPSAAETCRPFEAAGLRRVFTGTVVQQIAGNYDAYADKLSAGADTSLACLDAAEFERGLARMRARSRQAIAEPITEPIDVMVFETCEEQE